MRMININRSVHILKILSKLLVLLICCLAGRCDAMGICNAKEGGHIITIALDPGHGGEEEGANYYGEVEKDINLKLAHMVKEGLSEYEGIDVFMTRDEDEKVSLEQRAARAAAAGADILISLHCNASVSHVSNGASVYISTGENKRKELRDFADYFLGEFEALGLDNAGTYARVTQMGRRREDGSFDDYYGVIRHSYNYGMPAMIVEHCYMDNEKDWDFIRSDDGIRKLARADVNAIAAYYGLTSVEGVKYEGKHAAQYGATTKARALNYYAPPKLLGIKVTDFSGETPGMAEYELDVEDGVGINSIYLVYKNSMGNSITIPLMLSKEIKTGVHRLKGYIPENLEFQYYSLSYVGVYDKAGFDGGYNYWNGRFVGFGKCDWLNSFEYNGDADINITKTAVISTVLRKRLDEQMRLGIRSRQSVYPHEFRIKHQ